MPNIKPILFNGDMVRALLDNRKAVTRRVVKPQPKYAMMTAAGLMTSNSPISVENGIVVTNFGTVTTWEKVPYRPGDILYVCETWKPISAWDGSYTGCEIEYKAGGIQEFDKIIALPTTKGKWRPSIHMPREAARLFLRVINVSVAKLQDISSGDIEQEGIDLTDLQGLGCITRNEYVYAFQRLWDSTIKPADRALYGWDANPWVWVIEFERISKEEAYGKCK